MKISAVNISQNVQNRLFDCHTAKCFLYRVPITYNSWSTVGYTLKIFRLCWWIFMVQKVQIKNSTGVLLRHGFKNKFR